MAKSPVAHGAIREPLSYALATRARVASLRILSLIREPLTQREVARRARLQHRSVQLALDDLVRLGIVSRLEGGRDFLVSLNRHHRLAPALQQLFGVEGEHFLELRSALVRLARVQASSKEPLSLVVFGSAALGRDQPDSDLDVVLIASGKRSLDLALSRIEAAREQLRQQFGVEVRPIGFTLSHARRLWRQGQLPIADAYRHGIPLIGPPLRELLNGAR